MNGRLDDETFVACRKLSRTCKNFMEAGNLDWKRILKSYPIHTGLCKDYKALHVAAMTGQLDIPRFPVIDSRISNLIYMENYDIIL